MIEHEYLVAQHGQPVQMLRTFMMRDGDQRCLKARHVRFERDGDFVSEAPLNTGADRSQNHVAVADRPRPAAAARTKPG